MVVYDRLSVAALLDLAPADAERISVGKAPGHATMRQTDIDALLVARGLAGQEVVRLKGGDPFVFARGGEEAAALLAAGVPFEVVPGRHLGHRRAGLCRDPASPCGTRPRPSPW